MNLRPIEAAEGERKSNQARHRVIHWREQAERSEVRQDEWRRERKLKQARRDALHGLPYLQIASTFVTSGLLKELRPSSLRTYLALISRCDNVRRETWIGLKTVGEITGLAPDTIMAAYKQLKGYGLISRRRVARNGYLPYQTTLMPPSQWHLPKVQGNGRS